MLHYYEIAGTSLVVDPPVFLSDENLDRMRVTEPPHVCEISGIYLRRVDS